MKKGIIYGIIITLVIILQFVWLSNLINALFVISSTLSIIAFTLYTYDKVKLRNIYKILIYVAIFILEYMFIDAFATMITFPIIILINKILDHHKKIVNDKRFYIVNISLLIIGTVISFLIKDIWNFIYNNIISIIFVGIALLTFIYEANLKIKYNRFDVMDLIIITISTIIMLSLSIYNINGFNEVIYENNTVLEKIKNSNINTEMDINNMVNDVIETVGIEKIQEYENKTDSEIDLILFKGLKKTPVLIGSMIKSLTEKDEYQLGGKSFVEKKQWIEETKQKLTNIVTNINDYMCKPTISAIIVTDVIYFMGIFLLFYKRKDKQFE